MKKKIKMICMILAVIVLSALSAFGIQLLIRNRNVAETGNVLGVSWYNETDREFTITTKEQLYEFAELSKFYNFDKQTIKLGADIVVNEGNAEDWAKKAPKTLWKPITKFSGTFDGQGHTISGVYGIAHDSRIALFTDVNYLCTIKNTKLVNSYFKTSGQMGTASFVSGGGGKFIGLYSDAIFDHNGENVAGIVSKITKQTSVEECWFAGTINITSRDCGGIVDDVAGARLTMKHCLFSGTINQSYTFGGTRTGGLVGWVDAKGSLVLNDCLSSGKVNCEKTVYTGGVIGTTTGGSQNTIRDTFMVADAYEALIGTANGGYEGKPLLMRQEELTGIKAYQWTTLQFGTFWVAVEDDMPILKRFSEGGLSTEGVEKVYDISWYQPGMTSYEIRTLKQLYGFYLVSGYESFSAKNVKLGADIKVNEGTVKEWEKNAPSNPWYPIANFAGIFDGQGHTVSGIYVKSDVTYQGFFDKVAAEAVVKNLNIKNSYFESTHESFSAVGSIAGDFRGRLENIYSDAIIVAHANQAGGLIARANDSDASGIVEDEVVITNCWFDGAVYLKGEKTRYGGGIVGLHVQGDVNISHCLNTGLISSEALNTGVCVGGIVGTVWGSGRFTLTDSLNTGEIQVKYTTSVGSAVGSANQKQQTITIKNTYTTNESYTKAIGATINAGVIRLPEAWLTGYNAYRFTELDFPNYWAIVKTDTPILQHFASSDPSVAGIEKMIDTSWYSADKKEFTIKNMKQLYGFAMLAQTTNFEGQTVKLANDIALNAADSKTVQAWADGTVVPENTWLSIGTSGKAFAGTFDGQGHTISGVYLKTEEAYTGFFGKTTDKALIKNFRLVDSYFCNTYDKTSAFASVCGELYGDMANVYSNAIVVSHGNQAGGLIGRINDNDSDGVKDEVKITNCWFDGSLSLKGEKTNYGGGIAALQVQGDAVISHCLNTGTISSEAVNTGVCVGGIIGGVWKGGSFTLSDSLNTGKIDVKYTTSVGSVVGTVNQKKITVNIKNTYTTKESFSRGIGAAIDGGVIRIDEAWLTGMNAYKYTALDFPKYWAIVDGDTPVLQSFATSDPSTEGVKKAYNTSWYKADAKEFKINTVEKLYGFAILANTTDFEGQTVKLTKDLTVNATDAATLAAWVNGTAVPEKTWLPVGDAEKAFAGTFDGQGHSITGVYLNTNEAYTGFFGKTTDTAVIKNFGLADSYMINTKTGSNMFGGVVGDLYGDIDSVYSNAIVVSYGSQAGGIVGRANDPDSNKETDNISVTNCWFDGEFYFKGEKVQYGAGVVGYLIQGDLTMESCLNTGLVSTETNGTGLHTGGLIGAIRGTGTIRVSDSLNTGMLESINGGSVGFGSVIGNANKAEQTIILNNVFTTRESLGSAIGNATKASIKGSIPRITEAYLDGLGGFYTTTLDFDNKWVVRKDEAPALKAFVSKYAKDSKTLSLKNVTVPDTRWYDEDDAELYIDNEKEFYGLMRLASQGVRFYEQTIYLRDDLQLNKVEVDKQTGESSVDKWQAGTEEPTNIWLPIGHTGSTFRGTFDGQGHSIEGVYLNEDFAYLGLFGVTTPDSLLRDFELRDSFLRYVSEDSLEEEITAGIGSVCGDLRGDLEYVYSNAVVDSTGSRVGGLVGIPNGAEGSDGNLTTSTVQNCWYDGKVSGTGYARYVGGIAGRSMQGTIEITNCLNTGDVSNETTGGSQYVGGLLGGDQGGCQVSITDSISAGQVTVKNYSGVGSIVGNGSNTKTKYTYTNVYAVDTVCVSNGTHKTNGTYAADFTEAKANVTVIGNLQGLDSFFYTYLKFNDEAWAARDGEIPAPAHFVEKNDRLSTEGRMEKDITWFDAENKLPEYKLTTEEQLLGLAALVNHGENFDNITIKLDSEDKKFKLNTVDDAGNIDDTNKWIPIGTKQNPFSGIIEGNMCTITGLYAARNAQYTGFVGYADNATIQHVRLEKSYLESTVEEVASLGSIVGGGSGQLLNTYSSATLQSSGREVGGLVGTSAGMSIQGCWYNGEMTVDWAPFASASTTAARVGGIMGCGSEAASEINNCLFSGIVNISYVNPSAQSFYGANIGGICGYDGKVNLTIKNTISAGEMEFNWNLNDNDEFTYDNPRTSSDYLAAVIGSKCATKTTYSENVYSVDAGTWNVFEGQTKVNSGNITGNTPLGNLKGEDGFYNTLLDFNTMWTAREDKVPAPKLLVPESEQKPTAGLKRTDISWYEPDSNKTEYVLTEEEQLLGLAVLVNQNQYDFTGITIKLGDDMQMNEVNADILNAWKAGTVEPKVKWTPIGFYSSTAANARPFKGIFDGDHHTISGIYVEVNHTYAGIFGYLGNANAVIKNVRFVDSVVKTSATGFVSSGTVVGYGKGQLLNVYSNATLQSIGVANGGMVGYGAGLTMKGCWYAGTVDMDVVGTQSFHTGGLVGRAGVGGAILNTCLFTGTIDIDYTYGTANSSTEYLNENVGGLFGNDNNKVVQIQDSISDGTIDILWKYNGETSTNKRFGRINHVIGYEQNSGTTVSDVYYGNTTIIKAEYVNNEVKDSNTTVAVPPTAQAIGSSETYDKLSFQTTGALTDTPTWFKRTTGVPVPYAFKDITQ